MFGEIKSKIETYLVESYKENRFKSTLFVFEELVLKNKNISKIFFTEFRIVIISLNSFFNFAIFVSINNIYIIFYCVNINGRRYRR